MLFRKKMPKTCFHCLYARIKDEAEIQCEKRGARTADSPCRRYKYDPCKRIPPRLKAPDFSAFDADDFSL